MSDSQRLTELEVDAMVRHDLVEALDGELTAANALIQDLTTRVKVLEGQVRSLQDAVFGQGGLSPDS